jgi:chorismate mutase/prephenate dehydratase
LTLEEARKEIDRIDNQIKILFEERMEAADAVARIKAETHDKIYKGNREDAIISRLIEGVDPSILKEYTALIKKMMQVSRKYQYGKTLELLDCFNVEYITNETEAEGLETLELNSKETDRLNELLLQDKHYINNCVMKDKTKGTKAISLSKKLVVKEPHNRIYFVFSCHDKKGSLSTILSMISDYDVNITAIHTKLDVDISEKSLFF